MLIMSKTKQTTADEFTPNPKVPSGAVRPVVQLTPNVILTESLKPSRVGFTKSFEEALRKSENSKK